MFGLKKKVDPVLEQIELAIEDVTSDMLKHHCDSDEYAKCNKQLTELIKTRTEIKKSEVKISPETWALIIANLGGILLVLNHERLQVVSKSALGMVTKTRI